MPLDTLTRRAADAIIAQLACVSNDETTKYADVDGAELEFTVHYTTDWSRDRDGNLATCEIVGAWVADEDGEVIFAGNRAELEALIGDRLVSAWEYDISQNETDRGRW